MQTLKRMQTNLRSTRHSQDCTNIPKKKSGIETIKNFDGKKCTQRVEVGQHLRGGGGDNIRQYPSVNISLKNSEGKTLRFSPAMTMAWPPLLMTWQCVQILILRM